MSDRIPLRYAIEVLNEKKFCTTSRNLFKCTQELFTEDERKQYIDLIKDKVVY